MQVPDSRMGYQKGNGVPDRGDGVPDKGSLPRPHLASALTPPSWPPCSHLALYLAAQSLPIHLAGMGYPQCSLPMFASIPPCVASLSPHVLPNSQNGHEATPFTSTRYSTSQHKMSPVYNVLFSID